MRIVDIQYTEFGVYNILKSYAALKMNFNA
jgi:hypothetical protein